jgi:DNA repair protein RadC
MRREGRGLPDVEVLELLLTYAVPSRDMGPAAARLLQRFGDLRNVLAASARELEETEGVTPHVAALIQLVREVALRCSDRGGAPPEILRSEREIERRLLARFAGLREERLLVIFLDRHGVVLGEEFVGSGTIDQVVAFPRQVMEMVLRHRAASIILAHNHLHGPPLPSVRDREEAERMRDILRPFDVLVRDAVVVGRNRCFSIFANRPLT